MIKYTNNEFDWYKELKVMSNVMKNTKKKRFLLCSISFLMTFVCIFILYACLKVVPFGEKTLAWADADIQYLDFFSYFRDVLLGKNSIKYSMSNTLGNTSIGVYSYYLASPLNVLVLFFKQSQLLEFFSLLMAMKLSIASVTACYYLQVRFKDQIHPIVTCLLACAYGMMQYNMAQGSNIMWIDGVYMLPLIMLGVYKLVNTKRITALTIPVALSILFNWYTAGINCLWSGIILLIELALYVCREKVKIKDVLLVVVRYMVAMMIALCISAVLFLPSVMDLRNGRGSKFDWRLLTSTFTGRLLDVVRDYTIGGTSSSLRVSLFAGSLALLGGIAFFFNRNYKWKEKIVVGIGAIFAIYMYFYVPTNFVFSLLKSVESYWFRYSYVSIMYVIFVAGLSFAEMDKKIPYWLLAIGYCGVYIVSYLNPDIKREYTLFQKGITITFILIMAALIQFLTKICGEWQRLVIGLMAIVTLTELGMNARYLASIYSYDEGTDYKSYVVALNQQLAELNELDDGTYRIAQTSQRRNSSHLDEAFGYNYWSNTGYTSCPDNRQITFLDRLGYRVHGNRLNAVAGSVLTADSLLGVKYVIAGRDYPGLKRIDSIALANGKYVYENPYYLPMAVVYKAQMDQEFTNPFEYQNALYSQLLGEEVKLYTRITPTVKTEGNIRTYHIQVPHGNYALYGNIKTNGSVDGRVGKVGTEGFPYASWLARSVFDIEVEPGESEVSIFFEAEKGLDIADEQFYMLDLDVLNEAVSKIRDSQAEDISIKNGHIVCRVTAKEGEKLFLSVPVSEGWRIKRNDNIVYTETFADALTVIPLEEGENVIEMDFHIPHMRKAILISVLGMIMLLADICIQRRTAGKQVEELERN